MKKPFISTKVKGVKLISKYLINDRREIDPKMATEYSLMKYGDPKATYSIAVKIVDMIKADKEIALELRNGNAILVSSSFGHVPTGAFALTRQMKRILEKEGLHVKIIKIERAGAMGETHYCAMSKKAREEFMKKRTTWISNQNKKRIAGKFVIAVDDLSATGNHVKDIHSIISTTQAGKIRSIAYISFTPKLAQTDAATEGYLSRYKIKTLKDLFGYFQKPVIPQLELVLNTRTLKFILQTTPADESDLPEKKKVALLRKFIQTRDDYTLKMLYDAINSSDGYGDYAKFHQGITLIKTEYLSRKLHHRLLHLSLSEIIKGLSLFKKRIRTYQYQFMSRVEYK